MKFEALHAGPDMGLGLFFHPIDITFNVPISMNQFDALLHCDDDIGTFACAGLWNDVRKAAPIELIDYHLDLEGNGPYIQFSIPTDKVDEDIFKTIATALWATLDACVAELEHSEGTDAFQ